MRGGGWGAARAAVGRPSFTNRGLSPGNGARPPNVAGRPKQIPLPCLTWADWSISIIIIKKYRDKTGGLRWKGGECSAGCGDSRVEWKEHL